MSESSKQGQKKTGMSTERSSKAIWGTDPWESASSSTVSFKVGAG